MTTAAPEKKTAKAPQTNRLNLELKVYKGLESTLCSGCGHDSITNALIKSFFEYGVEPHMMAKLSGIRPQIAQTIVHLGVDLGTVITKATLADAFAIALRRLGLGVVKVNAPKKRRPDADGHGHSDERAED